VGWLPEGPVLAADYCECESTKIAGIKRRAVETTGESVEMERIQSSQNSRRKRFVCVFS